VKQKAFCGEENIHSSGCLRMQKNCFWKKLVNIHVLLLILWSRLQLFVWRMDEKCLIRWSLCDNPENSFSQHKRLWNVRTSQRWEWLLFVLRLLWWVIFLLVAAWIHYNFSYFIPRQHKKHHLAAFSTKLRHSLRVKQ
jgi:hypothetical protein